MPKTNTHDVARILDIISNKLRSIPTIELSSIPMLSFHVSCLSSKEDARKEFAALREIVMLPKIEEGISGYNITAVNPLYKSVRVYLCIDKDIIGEKRTTTKEVTEYIIPETGEII